VAKGANLEIQEKGFLAGEVKFHQEIVAFQTHHCSLIASMSLTNLPLFCIEEKIIGVFKFPFSLKTKAVVIREEFQKQVERYNCGAERNTVSSSRQSLAIT
jgi:hypothetical protein